MLSFDIRSLERPRRPGRRRAVGRRCGLAGGRSEARRRRSTSPDGSRRPGRAGSTGTARSKETSTLECRRCLDGRLGARVRGRAPHLRRGGRRGVETIRRLRSPIARAELDLRPALGSSGCSPFRRSRVPGRLQGLCPTCGADLNAGAATAPPRGRSALGCAARSCRGTDSTESHHWSRTEPFHRLSTHGRPEATYLEAEEARPQHAQDSARRSPSRSARVARR